MLTDVLTNTFGINLMDAANFSNNSDNKNRSTTIFFKYICKCYTNDGNDDIIFDENSYVYLDDKQYSAGGSSILLNKVIDYIMNDMYINRFPKTQNPSVSRFITKFSINVSMLSVISTMLTNLITERNIPNTVYSKKYLIGLQRCILELDKYCLKFETDEKRKNCRLYIDLLDSVVNSSSMSIYSKDSNIPLFTTNSLADKVKIKDFPLNFSDKVDGIISASFNLNPFTLSSPLSKVSINYDFIDGSFMKITNNKITLDYIGSIIDPHMVYNYKEFKSSLKLTFVPENGRIFKTKEEFNKFNDLVEYIDSGVHGQVDNKLIEIPIRLDRIEITSILNKKDSPYAEDVDIYKLFKTFLKSIYPNELTNENDIYINKLITSDELQDHIIYDKLTNSISFESDKLPSFYIGANFYYG